MAAALAMSFAMSADAATSKHRVSAQIQASCKAEAAKKYSAIHFMKRRNFVNNCVAEHANAKAHAKAKPTSETTNQTTSGQAPKKVQ